VRNLRWICASLKPERRDVDVPDSMRKEANMRALAISTLVLGSLLFSVGGVTAVRADDSNQSMSVPAAPSQALPTKTKEECTPPKRFEVRAAVSKVDDKDTVVLNTRGYNYPRPGEIRPEPPARKDNASAPASPAK
jgi:hypothetical protein